MLTGVEWSGWMGDTPQIVMTTRAPAVLKTGSEKVKVGIKKFYFGFEVKVNGTELKKERCKLGLKIKIFG